MSLDLKDLHFAYGKRTVLEGVDTRWDTGQMWGSWDPMEPANPLW